MVLWRWMFSDDSQNDLLRGKQTSNVKKICMKVLRRKSDDIVRNNWVNDRTSKYD